MFEKYFKTSGVASGLAGDCCIVLFLCLVSSFFGNVAAFSYGYQIELNESEVGRSFPPNDHDLFNALSKPENLGKEVELIVDVFGKQKPMISKESLWRLIETKQNSVRSFRSKYTVLEEIFDGDQNLDVSKNISYEFAFLKNKLYFAYEIDNAGNSEPSVVKRSYDGERIISLLTYPDGHLHAGIGDPDPGILMDFFHPGMPLTLARLFDTRLCGTEFSGFSLMLLMQGDNLCGVFEKMEMVDGRECLVVADLSSRYYLDPQKDFSVVQVEGYLHEYSGTGALVGRWLASRSKLFDLKDHGNGIWIPSRAMIEVFDMAGNVTLRNTVDVSFVEVNKGIDDSFFTGFIPGGIPVADAMLGLSYLYGERPSINDTLKSVVKSKRVWTFQIISVTLGTIMIIVALLMKYLAYRKRKLSE